MCRPFADLLLRASAIFFVTTAAAAPAGGEFVVITLDPQQTSIEWALAGFPDTVHGTFRLDRGRLGFDADSGAAAGCLRVEASSGDSGNASRDRKMHEQILETVRFPEVTLRPTRVDGRWPAEGRADLGLLGVLSLHGAEHPVTLPVRVARSGSALTADATLTIPYVAWGLTDPSVFVFRARKTVDLVLHTVGVVTPSAPRPLLCEP